MMVYQAFLVIFTSILVNSVHGILYADCSLSVVDGQFRLEMKCTCPPGTIPNGLHCIPLDLNCPNGYFDIFDNTCKCFVYKTNLQHDNNTLSCESLCGEGCLNGICVAPGKCHCYDGFTAYNEHMCLGFPQCKLGCENGHCFGPNWCICKTGYVRTSENKCNPVCSNPCLNGFCSEPEKCSCHMGYEWSPEENICKPFCFGCENGACLSTGECSCKEGYLWNTSTTICEPICSEGCGLRKVCIAPDFCVWDGLDDDGKYDEPKFDAYSSSESSHLKSLTDMYIE